MGNKKMGRLVRMKALFFVCILLCSVIFSTGFASAAGSQSKEVTYTDMVSRMNDMQALAYPADEQEKTSESSAYNKLSKYDPITDSYVNWGQNYDEGYDSPRTPEGGYIFADIKGPGSIVRIWSANPQNGHIKIFIDDQEQPVVDMPFCDLFNEKGAFPFNLGELSYDASRGKNCYVPITFSKSCKIVADEGWGMFYQVNYVTFSEDTVVEAFPRKFTAEQQAALEGVNSFFSQSMGSAPQAYENVQTVRNTVTVNPGEKTLVYESKESGAITGIKMKLDGVLNVGEDWDALSEMTMSAYWDGQETPSVWSTLGGFFASTTGLAKYQSLPLGVEADGTMYAYWYMPFEKGAKLLLGNDGTKARTVTFELTTAPLAPAEARSMMRFHAKWNRMKDPSKESNDRWPDSQFLYTEGTGRYVGTSMHIYKEIGTGDPAYNADWWWGEGDEKFFVDGEKFPSWFGTGAEDYFGYAWGTWDPFARAYHSQPFTNGGMFGIGNRLNNRFHILDSVPFQKSFDANLEKYHRDGYANMVVTNFWYLEADGFDPYLPVSLEERTEYYENPTPAPETFYEGEAMKIVSSSGMDKAETQDMTIFGKDVWSGNSQLILKTGLRGYVKLSLNAPEDGYYDLSGAFTMASDFGVVQHYLDDAKLGEPVDLYHANVTHLPEVGLGTVYLTKGIHQLEARMIGKNANSRGYFYGLDALTLSKNDSYEPPEGVEQLLEGEDLALVSKNPGELPVNIQNMDAWGGEKWSNHTHRVLVPRPDSGIGTSATFAVPVSESGKYRISAVMTLGPDFGIAHHSMDKTPLGSPMDFYDPAILPTPMNHLGEMYLTKGTHEFTIELIDKNPQSTGYVYGLDCILLTPLPQEKPVAVLSDMGTIIGEVDTAASTRLSLSGIPENAQYRSIEAVASIPSDLNVTKVSASVVNKAVKFDYKRVGDTLRFAFISTDGEALSFTKEELAKLVTIDFVLNAPKAENDTLTVVFERVSIKTGDTQQDKEYDVSGAVSTAVITASRSAAAREMYVGDGVELIPANKRAVAVEFIGVETADSVKLGDTVFCYSPEKSELAKKVTFVGLVDRAVTDEQLSRFESYTVGKADGESLLFGDTDDSGSINAQDGLNVLYTWLRRGDAPDDRMILIMNVTADAHIDTGDSIAVLDKYLAIRDFAVISK